MCHDTMVSKFAEVWAILKCDSERGSVIMAAAIHDDILKDILLARLTPCDKASDPLFSGRGAAIGSMAARIDLAHRTGCISSTLSDSLHALRKLRNDFAHLPNPINFEDQSVKDRTNHLLKLNKPLFELIWPALRDMLSKDLNVDVPLASEDLITDMSKYIKDRTIFEIWASIVAGFLAEKSEKIEQII